MRKVLLIDGTNLLMRVVGAAGETAPERDIADAAEGLARAAVKHIEATHCAVIFDGVTSGNGRRALLPSYKANRTPGKTEKWSALGVEEFTRRGLACVSAKWWEGDDYLATMAVRATRAGLSVAVLSADSDMLELLPVVEVWQYGSKADGQRFVRRTPEWVQEKYGVAPWQLADFKALAGEPTDNVVGPFGKHCVARARKLLAKHGSVEAEGMREELTAEQLTAAHAARTVLRLRVDVDVPRIGMDALRVA